MNGSLPDQIAPDTGPSAELLIELLRALADPIRLRLLRLLEAQPANGLSVGELGEILKLPQSTISRHLKTLADAHLADSRRDGTSAFYKLSDARGLAGDTARQLRLLARNHHYSLAKNDAHRLAAILRRRELATGANDSFFGKHAPQWDLLRAQWFGDTFHLEALLALLNPAWTIADIGTGTGAMLPLLAPQVHKIIAVDPSPAMLKGAKSRIKDQHLDNVDLRQGSAESLPIDKSSIDVALLALVLAYTPDPPAAFREIRRILKPGGILLIVDLQPHSVDLFRKQLHHRWMGFSQDQLTSWLKDAGFINPRWHPLVAKSARSKKSSPNPTHEATTPIPDLFALRAEASHA